MKFRIATQKDAEYLYEQLLNDDNDVPLKLGLYGVDDELLKNSPYRVSFVGEIEEQTVCFLKVQSADPSGFSYINMLYVLPEHRRKGVGLKALNFAIKYCRNNWNSCGVDFLTIENEAMESLAIKAGFTLSGTYKSRYYLNENFYNESRFMKIIRRTTSCHK